MAELTDTGLVIDSQSEILARVVQNQRAVISPTWDPDPDQPTGQINGILARSEAELQELVEDTYHQMDPSAATGNNLDLIGRLRGIPRDQAKPASLTMNIIASAPFTLLAGVHLVENEDVTGQFWTPVQDTAISAGTNTHIPFVCTVTGPDQEAEADALVIIATPVAGWESCYNSHDSTPGSDVESDYDYNVRMDARMAYRGSSNIDAVAAAVDEVFGVDTARVNENTTLAEVDGIPPKAFEIIVDDGSPSIASNDAIAQAIWDSKPAGIEAHGDVTGTATDKSGTPRTVKFSRVVDVLLYVEVDLEYSGAYDLSGDATKAAVAAIDLPIARDAVPSTVVAAVRDLAGVENVTEVRIGNTISPSYTPRYVIGSKERGVCDVARVVVNATQWVDS